MSYNLLKGKKGIIFGALDENSIAWKTAERVFEEINKKLSGKVVTKISLLKNYCPAEEYHQMYLKKKR